MSYPVNQKLNPYNQPTMGINSIPMQNVDSEKVRQGVNGSPIVKTTKQDSPLLLLGVMAPTAVATAWGMSKFNDKCRGEYKESLVGKIGAWGDKIGSSKLFTNSFTSSINKKYISISNYIKDKIIPKNKITRAFFTTPTHPENHNALTMAGGTINELASSAVQLFEKFTDKGANVDKVKQLGFVKANGEVDMDKYHDIVKNSHKYSEEITKICEKQGLEGCYQQTKGGKIPWSKKLFGEEKYLSELLPFTKKILCRKVYFSEYTNKLNAVKGIKNTAQTTILGKVLPKTTLRVIEGLTNASTGGGALGIIMGSYIIADAIVKTIKSDKGEKTKTFAENMIYNLGWYLTLPFAIGLMHKVGGLKYIGMSKEQVAAFRADLEAFNAKAKSGGFNNKKTMMRLKKH